MFGTKWIHHCLVPVTSEPLDDDLHNIVNIIMYIKVMAWTPISNSPHNISETKSK